MDSGLFCVILARICGEILGTFAPHLRTAHLAF